MNQWNNKFVFEDMKSSETFFDNVFAIIALICIIVSTIDWLLGSKWQKKSRDKFEDYWLKLADLSLDLYAKEALSKGFDLINTLALKLRRILIKVHKGWKSTFLIFVLPSLLWWTIIFVMNDTSFARNLGAFGGRSNLIIQIILIVTLCYLSIGGVIYFVLLPFCLILLITTHITLALLKLMMFIKSFIAVLIISIIDLLISYLIFLPFAKDIGIGWGGVNKDFPSYDLFAIYSYDRESGIMAMIIFIISFLPTGIHLFVALFYSIIRILDKTAKPLAQLIILRISESKDGALTQLTIGIGVLIKTAQEVVKLMI